MGFDKSPIPLLGFGNESMYPPDKWVFRQWEDNSVGILVRVP